MSNLRDAFRTLRASPLVSTVAVLSLALGIGATTAMLSIVDSLILRPIPVQQPERLALLTTANSARFSWTNPIWEEIRDQPDLFDGALAWSTTQFNLNSGGETRYINGIMASGGFFDVLGVPAQVGRVFHPSDDARGGGPEGAVAVLSYDYWQRAYGGASDVVGRPLLLSSVSYTIIGVTAPQFAGPEVGRPFDVVVPLGTEPLLRGPASMLDGRSSWWLQVMIRRKPEQSLSSAEAALRAVQARIREATLPTQWRPEHLSRYLDTPFALQSAANGASRLRTAYQAPLLTILVVTGLVLLIACGNIANLLLARASARRHELSVRQALGASRMQLVRQLFTESALLAGIGTVLGTLIAVWGSRMLVHQLSTPTDRVVLDLGLDWRFLAIVTVVAAGTALLFGTAPALKAASADPMDAMKEHGRDGSAGRSPLGSGLVIAQVALSLVLVVGAALFVRTFSTLANRDLGFQTNQLLTARVAVDRTGVPEEQRNELFRRITEEAGRVPGVASAAVAAVPLVSGMTWNNSVEVPGGLPRSEDDGISNLNAVTPGWFATVGVPIVAGRDFQASDGAGGPKVAIVNQAFVKHFLGSDDAIGRIINLPGDGPTAPPEPVTIVGISADAVYASVREDVPPTLFQPLAQQGPGPSATLNIHAGGRIDGALLLGLSKTIEAINPAISITFLAMDDLVEGALIRERLVAWLSAFFGGLALLLAGLGLYGVTAYAVSQRRNEIGIRMAIGAAPTRILRLVLGRVGAQIGLGVVIGGAISLWAARFVESLLYGLPARDPMTFALAALVLTGIGVVAGWLPARRAAAIDPARVLRDG